jgi:mannose-6-phosphate isomerase-like protein (cupin superfamily)
MPDNRFVESTSCFTTMALPDLPDAIAPDGSEVRLLLALSGGGMAHFTLASGKVSKAVFHRSVEEIWYFIAGSGQMWRSLDGTSEIVEVRSGVCITIPVGTTFQFRSSGTEPLSALGVTMPPWPGEHEAVLVDREWRG